MNGGEVSSEEEEEWGIIWDESVNQKEVKFAQGQKTHKRDMEIQDNKSKITSSTSSSLFSRMQLNDNKAGMEGLNKEKINQIIYEASKGSKYYENEMKKEEQVNKRITEQKAKKEKLSPQSIVQAEHLANDLLEELEATRDLTRSIVHIDMDAFYAAVEMRDDPSLRSKPMAVGGNDMLSTSNYKARKYGVRAAMPGFIGKKLCPELVIVPTNFEKYTAVSKQIREIMADYDSNFCPMSLDEAYLDFTDHLNTRRNLNTEERSFTEVRDVFDCACRLSVQKVCVNTEEGKDKICDVCGHFINMKGKKLVFGCDVEEAVKEMRHRIHLKTRLTASAGIAPNTMLAKVCSDKNKPNGQYRIQPEREKVMEFIQDLPIRKVSGIGKVSEKMLSGLGVVKCSDLYTHRGLLNHLYSNISYNYFMRICLGLGSTQVCRDGDRKSLSTERTFREIYNPQEQYEMCDQLSHDVVEDLKQEKLWGKTVAIKLKTVKFEVKTRAHTLTDYTQSYEQIQKAAKDLLKIEIAACQPQPLRLRLMGVRISNLVHENEISKQRQNTITSFLKKQTGNSAEQNKLSPKQTQKTKSCDSLLVEIMEKKYRENNDIKKADDLQHYTKELIRTPDMSNEFGSSGNNECNNIDINKLSGLDETSNGNVLNKDDVASDNCLVCNGSSCNCIKSNVKSTATVKATQKDNESIVCPVCSRTIKSTSMTIITNHIDYCLVRNNPNSESPTQTGKEVQSKKSNQNQTDVTLSLDNEFSSPSRMTKRIIKISPKVGKDLERNETVCNEDKVLVNHSINITDKPKLRDDNFNETSVSTTSYTSVQSQTNKILTSNENFNLVETEQFTHYSKSHFRKIDNDIKIVQDCDEHDELYTEGSKSLFVPVGMGDGIYTENRPLCSNLDSMTTNCEEGITICLPANRPNGIRTVTTTVIENEKGVVDNSDNSNNLKGSFVSSLECSSISNIADEISKRSQCVDNSVIPSTSTTAKNMHQYMCPVCNIGQNCQNLSSFNKHVDTCLSKQTIRELLSPKHSLSNTSTSVNNSYVTQGSKRPHGSKGKLLKNKKRKIEKGLQTLEGFIKIE